MAKVGLERGIGIASSYRSLCWCVLRSVLVGVLLFALGAILFAVRGYLDTGDKAVAGALIFVDLMAIGIETVIYFWGP